MKINRLSTLASVLESGRYGFDYARYFKDATPHRSDAERVGRLKAALTSPQSYLAEAAGHGSTFCPAGLSIFLYGSSRDKRALIEHAINRTPETSSTIFSAAERLLGLSKAEAENLFLRLFEPDNNLVPVYPTAKMAAAYIRYLIAQREAARQQLQI